MDFEEARLKIGGLPVPGIVAFDLIRSDRLVTMLSVETRLTHEQMAEWDSFTSAVEREPVEVTHPLLNMLGITSGTVSRIDVLGLFTRHIRIIPGQVVEFDDLAGVG